MHFFFILTANIKKHKTTHKKHTHTPPTIEKMAAYTKNKATTNPTANMTPEEKEEYNRKQKQQYVKNLHSAANSGTSSGSAAFTGFTVPLWEADIGNFSVEMVDGIPQSFYTITSGGVKKKVGESYYMAVTCGYTKGSRGVGERFIDVKAEPNPDAKNFVNFADYSQKMSLFFDEFPEEVIKYNPNAPAQMDAQKKYLLAREEKIFKWLDENPSAYAVHRTNCKKTASQLPKTFSAAQIEESALASFRAGIKLGMHRVSRTVTGADGNDVEIEALELPTKTLTFVENKASDTSPPAEVTEILGTPNHPDYAAASFIARAYKQTPSLMIRKPPVYNRDRTRRPVKIFAKPFNDGTFACVTVNAKAYDQGQNRGWGFHASAYHVWVDVVSGGGNDDEKLAEIANMFVPPAPRTADEITVLTYLKQHADKEAGVSGSELISALVECVPPKLTRDELAEALALLAASHFIKDGKDANHQKIVNPGIDVAKLPVKPKEPAQGASLFAGFTFTTGEESNGATSNEKRAHDTDATNDAKRTKIDK